MNDLQRKVTTYFQQYPSRRMLFFFDADRRYTEDIRALAPTTFEVLRLDPPYAFFGMKVRLNSRAAHALPVLLYCPGMQSPLMGGTRMGRERSETDPHSFPLLDLLVANDELRLDPVAEFIAKYSLQAHHRELVERYQAELLRKDPSGILQPLLSAESFEEAALQHALTARVMGFKTLPDVNTLIAKLLMDRVDRPADQANT